MSCCTREPSSGRLRLARTRLPCVSHPSTRSDAPSEYDDQWRCRWCRQWFVVPSLARQHERVCPTRPTNPDGRASSARYEWPPTLRAAHACGRDVRSPVVRRSPVIAKAST